jgi:hypothetical protein
LCYCGDTGGVGELHGGADEPGHDDRPDPHILRAGRDADAVRLRVEPRSRAEYAADLEQREAEGSFRAAGGEVLRRFEPGRAGLPETRGGEAAAYLEAHRAERPWLGAAAGCPAEVQRVFAALDRGGGHAHIRHEGWVTEEMNRRRVAYLEDPAQLDPAKRAAGIDGLASPEKRHRCRDSSSRITDPEAFAVAFARGIEHPLVRAALDTGFTAGRVPRPVTVDVSSLLGPDGQRYCTGWRLQPVDGSMDLARERRATWVKARSRDSHTATPEPDVRPAGIFDGGVVVFAFGPNRARDGYEVVTMYPRPPKDDQQGDSR